MRGGSTGHDCVGEDMYVDKVVGLGESMGCCGWSERKMMMMQGATELGL